MKLVLFILIIHFCSCSWELHKPKKGRKVLLGELAGKAMSFLGIENPTDKKIKGMEKELDKEKLAINRLEIKKEEKRRRIERKLETLKLLVNSIENQTKEQLIGIRNKMERISN